MLLKRVISSLVGIPVLLLAVWQGGWVLFVLTLSIMLFALFELDKMFSAMDIKGPLPLMIVGVLILSAGAYQGGIQGMGLMTAPVVLVTLSVGLLLYPKVKPWNIAGSIMGIFYVGLFLFFYLTRNLENGQSWVLIMLAGTWAGDIMAFVVGKKIGKRKLAPRLSPGKTVEGALGGILGSVLAVSFANYFFMVASMRAMIALGILLGIMGMMGDLFESSLKRTAGLKDTGVIIPGHGGILDRFDSLLFIAPVIYYSIIYLIGR